MSALTTWLAAFLAAHHYVAMGLGGWVALATFANAKLWPKRADMRPWERYLHLFLVDLPSLLSAPGYRGVLGRLGVPFFSVSMDPSGRGADDAPQS